MRPVWVLLLLAPSSARALEAFSQRALEKAQSSGGLAVVQVYSAVSPVCRRQAAVLGRLARSEDAVATFLQADFDRHAAFRRAHRIEGRCTLLAFRRGVLIGGEAGLTTDSDIRAFLHRSLMRARGRPKPRSRPPASGRR